MSTRQTYTTLVLEAAGFSLVILLMWADEYLDLPHLLFGAPPTPVRLSEVILEGGVTLLLGLVVMIASWRTNRRVTELERLLMICASCRKVWVDGRWLTFERYLEERDRIMTSHSVCPTCFDREMDALGADNPGPSRA